MAKEKYFLAIALHLWIKHVYKIKDYGQRKIFFGYSF